MNTKYTFRILVSEIFTNSKEGKGCDFCKLVFPMIYTVTITHTEMHLQAEVFLNNGNESKREKGSLHGGTVGSTPASSRCWIPFLPLTNPTDPA